MNAQKFSKMGDDVGPELSDKSMLGKAKEVIKNTATNIKDAVLGEDDSKSDSKSPKNVAEKAQQPAGMMNLQDKEKAKNNQTRQFSTTSQPRQYVIQLPTITSTATSPWVPAISTAKPVSRSAHGHSLRLPQPGVRGAGRRLSGSGSTFRATIATAAILPSAIRSTICARPAALTLLSQTRVSAVPSFSPLAPFTSIQPVEPISQVIAGRSQRPEKADPGRYGLRHMEGSQRRF